MNQKIKNSANIHIGFSQYINTDLIIGLIEFNEQNKKIFESYKSYNANFKNKEEQKIRSIIILKNKQIVYSSIEIKTLKIRYDEIVNDSNKTNF